MQHLPYSFHRTLLTWIATMGTLLFSLTVYSHSYHDHGVPSIPKMGLNVTNARVNPVVEGMPATAVYFDITNHTNNTLRLVAANSPLSNRVEIHEHTMSDGLMKMQEVANGVELPAGKTIKFVPGGYHIMIMNLDRAIEEGDSVELTLLFSDNSKQIIKAVAKRPSHQGHKNHHSHDKHKHH